MWLIPVIVIVVLALFLLIIFLINRHDNGDYKDGGGTQVGGDERIPFFTPANERAGIIGERKVNYHLRPLLREDEYLLANVLLPLKNGYKTEIDCILISRKGIFCIETKNWVGHIYGNDVDEYWIQKYDDPSRANRHHKNPVLQNESHCEILERKLNNRYPVDNVVIFVDLEDAWGINSNYAFTISQFKNYYRNLGEGEIMSTELISIYQVLRKYVATPEQLEEHRRETRNRYN